MWVGSDGQASPVARGLVVLFAWDIMMFWGGGPIGLVV